MNATCSRTSGATAIFGCFADLGRSWPAFPAKIGGKATRLP
jgi:hypothetical protein